MAGLGNRLLVAPGIPLNLGGTVGGELLLQRPGEAAGAMSFQTMQNRVWHLLREPGPDTGFPIPTTGDYPVQVVQRDLNIMLAQFISATGLAPALTDRFGVFPVFPILDYPLPPDCQSLTRVEYTPAGQQTYTLLSKSFGEFDAFWQNETLSTGQPFVFRQPWAGYIRLFPQPGPGQATGPGVGTITFNGTITAGNTVSVVITNTPNSPITIPTYTVKVSDTTGSIAQAVANLINASNAVVGPGAFLRPCGTSANSLQLTAINPPGTNISYGVTLNAGSTLSVIPNGTAFLQPNGDTMTFYYSSTGSVMYLPNDACGLPPQFHMAIVYGVLADYWLRKQDPDGLARIFKSRYDEAVMQGKKLEWDVDRSTQPTTASYFDTDLDTASGTMM